MKESSFFKSTGRFMSNKWSVVRSHFINATNINKLPKKPNDPILNFLFIIAYFHDIIYKCNKQTLVVKKSNKSAKSSNYHMFWLPRNFVALSSLFIHSK